MVQLSRAAQEEDLEVMKELAQAENSNETSLVNQNQYLNQPLRERPLAVEGMQHVPYVSLSSQYSAVLLVAEMSVHWQELQDERTKQ